MPVVGSVLGYNIFFSSNEGYPLEPIHVYVDRKPSAKSPKFWLLKNGDIQVAKKGFLKDKEIAVIVNCLRVQYAQLVIAWKKHFSVENVTFYKESQEKNLQR